MILDIKCRTVCELCECCCWFPVKCLVCLVVCYVMSIIPASSMQMFRELVDAVHTCFAIVNTAIIGIGAQSTLGGTTFLPEKYVRKINKMSKFYMTHARKLAKHLNFYDICRKKIKKFPNFT